MQTQKEATELTGKQNAAENTVFAVLVAISISHLLNDTLARMASGGRLVYAQELVPGRVGMISGLFFGFAFGTAGIGSAVLGRLADQTSISFVFQVCSFLPFIGLLTAFLPNLGKQARGVRQEDR